MAVTMSLKITIKHHTTDNLSSACLIVGIQEKRKLTDAAQMVDSLCNGFIKKVMKKGDMDGKLRQTLLLHEVETIPAQRVLLVGCGKEKEFTTRQYKKVIAAAVKSLKEYNVRDAVFYLTELSTKDLNHAQRIVPVPAINLLQTGNRAWSQQPVDSGKVLM